jgi:hypothetical protein
MTSFSPPALLLPTRKCKCVSQHQNPKIPHSQCQIHPGTSLAFSFQLPTAAHFPHPHPNCGHDRRPWVRTQMHRALAGAGWAAPAHAAQRRPLVTSGPVVAAASGSFRPHSAISFLHDSHQPGIDRLTSRDYVPIPTARFCTLCTACACVADPI